MLKNKIFLYIIIGILILIILSLLTYKKTENIKFKEDEIGQIYDFGTINSEISKINHTFKIINRNYESIKIYGVRDACDCTKSTVMEGNYKRNDTISVNVSYDHKKYEDKGKITKEIFLLTNKKVSLMDTIYPLTLQGTIEK